MVFFFEMYVLERCDYDNDDTTITHDTMSLGVYITDVNEQCRKYRRCNTSSRCLSNWII